MSPQPDKAKLDRLAADNGLAVAIVCGNEQLGASNDNSICRTLNPDGVFVGLWVPSILALWVGVRVALLTRVISASRRDENV